MKTPRTHLSHDPGTQNSGWAGFGWSAMNPSIHSSLIRLRCSAAAVWAGFGRGRSAPPYPALDRGARLFRFRWDHASSALSSRPAWFTIRCPRSRSATSWHSTSPTPTSQPLPGPCPSEARHRRHPAPRRPREPDAERPRQRAKSYRPGLSETRGRPGDPGSLRPRRSPGHRALAGGTRLGLRRVLGPRRRRRRRRPPRRRQHQGHRRRRRRPGRASEGGVRRDRADPPPSRHMGRCAPDVPRRSPKKRQRRRRVLRWAEQKRARFRRHPASGSRHRRPGRDRPTTRSAGACRAPIARPDPPSCGRGAHDGGQGRPPGRRPHRPRGGRTCDPAVGGHHCSRGAPGG